MLFLGSWPPLMGTVMASHCLCGCHTQALVSPCTLSGENGDFLFLWVTKVMVSLSPGPHSPELSWGLSIKGTARRVQWAGPGCFPAAAGFPQPLVSRGASCQSRWWKGRLRAHP